MILKEVKIKDYFGISELQKRLRRVTLRGFPDVRIYEDSQIELWRKTPEEIREGFFVPQPTVYRKGFLDRIDRLAELFLKRGLNVFELVGGIDYTAITDEGKSEWTLIPPVVEVSEMPFKIQHIDYSLLLSPRVLQLMGELGCGINPDALSLSYSGYPLFGWNDVSIVCDGSHRIHSALEKNVSQSILMIRKTKPGFPYYAAPKPYSEVVVENERPEKGATTKTHILESPAHKSLYRLFPTGGILNGTVRPE